MIIWILPLVLNASPIKADPAVTSKNVSVTTPLKLKRQVVDEKLDNLPAVLMEARLEARPPHGYEFTDIDAGSIYDVLGFKIGDVLMEINGERVNSSLQAAQLILALKTESKFNVKIKRGAKVSSLTYRIED